MAQLKNTTVDDSGFLRLPIGNTATRPGTPTQGMTRYNTQTAVVEFYNGTTWVGIGLLDGSSPTTAAASAQAIKNLTGTTTNAHYWINWANDGVARRIWCEMNLESGGWMMIANYNKTANVNGGTLTRTSTFPQMGTEYTFANEEGSTGADGTWGHISNSLANQHPWTQYMFYGRTSGHSRVVHFRGNNTNIVSYIKTGSGAMVPHYADTGTNFNGSLRVNASIPLFVNNDRSGFTNQGDAAMTEFPIYGESTIGNPRAHWAMRGQGQRWEVDDFPGNASNATIHRIWVK
jgi:hypothetical protein